jgi:hypothetical protein
VVLLLAVVLGLLIGLVSGGSLRNASGLRIRFLPLLISALLAQVMIFSSILGDTGLIHDLGPYIYIVTLLMSFAVMLLNFQIPAMPLIALGALLNMIVIVANGGYMPSPESALREVGIYDSVVVTEEEKSTGDYVLTNSTVADDDTRLRFLGDVIPLPDFVPFANVISIGDIFIAIGAAAAVVLVMHRRPRETEPAESEVITT